MRSGIVTLLIVVVLCAGAVAEPPAQNSQAGTADPNDLNAPAAAPNATEPWDPAEHLVANWDGVALTSELPNPQTQPDLDEHRSLLVDTQVAVIDPNGLIGLSTTPHDLIVLDQDGAVLVDNSDRGQPPRVYQPPQYWERYERYVGNGQWFEELAPYQRSVGVRVDPNRGYPVSLSHVAWTMYALTVTEVNVIDIPFAPADEWVELVPGLDVLVEEASVSDHAYSYRIKARYHHAEVAHLVRSFHLRSDERPPGTIVLGIDVLDGEGRSIRGVEGGGPAGGTFATGIAGQLIATTTDCDSCSDCGDATTIRYRIARNATEVEWYFVLKNVPVPTF